MKTTLRSILMLSAAFACSQARAAESMRFLDFDAGVPKNKAGADYPNQYSPDGVAQIGVIASQAVISYLPPVIGEGKSLKYEVTSGSFYPQFNAHNANDTRGFTREYVANPAGWKFNTFNRLTFWINNPKNGQPVSMEGRSSLQFGTYVKRVANADPRSDETGGGHWYHHFNVPNTGTWTKIVLNTHPHHFRGESGNEEQGNQLHPTGEAAYNYFDALTRFYMHETKMDVTTSPIVYHLDRFEFIEEANPENDDQVYSIATTYVPEENRFYLTWSRPKDQNDIKHEVRYSTRSIHEIGWNAANPAPGGIITPPSSFGYNGMAYTTTAITIQAEGTLYFAIKPQNSQVFSQIALPVSKPGFIGVISPMDHRAVSLNGLLSGHAGAELRVTGPSGRHILSATLPGHDPVAFLRTLERKAVDGCSVGFVRISGLDGKPLWSGPLSSLRP